MSSERNVPRWFSDLDRHASPNTWHGQRGGLSWRDCRRSLPRRDPNGGAQLDALEVGRDCAAYRSVEPTSDGGRFLLVRQGLAEDDELVTADPSQDVRRTGHGQQLLPDCAQNFVAGVMAIAIIHPLEAIEVDEQHGEDRSVALESGERLFGVLDQCRSVAEARERVVGCVKGELCLTALVGRDVDDRHHESRAIPTNVTG